MKKEIKKSLGRVNELAERRGFLGSAAALAGAAFLGVSEPSARAADPGWLEPPFSAPPLPPPGMSAPVERRVGRWQDQRWLLDAVVQTVGVEWDQGRLGALTGVCGPEILGDVAALRARVRRFNDMYREFARAAARRERIARDLDAQGRTLSARDQYFFAAQLYALAQWPIFENTRENLALNERKNICYAKFMKSADHEIRRVEVPFGGKTLPGYLHLPPNLTGRVPCVWSISGLDSTKETGSPLNGDKLLERGIATLALEGPGQAECAIREIYLTQTNWQQAGPAVLSWLRSQKEIDPDRIGLRGVSLGTSLASIVAAVDDRLSFVAVAAMTHEPHLQTGLASGSPSFMLRFMYYAGMRTETELAKFLETWDIQPLAAKIKVPYLAIAGEDDQVSRIEYTYQFFDNLVGPKQLLVYEGAEHSVSNAQSVALGPSAAAYAVDWMKDRFEGKPCTTKFMKVDGTGNVHESSFEDARKMLSLIFLPQPS